MELLVRKFVSCRVGETFPALVGAGWLPLSPPLGKKEIIISPTCSYKRNIYKLLLLLRGSKGRIVEGLLIFIPIMLVALAVRSFVPMVWDNEGERMPTTLLNRTMVV